MHLALDILLVVVILALAVALVRRAWNDHQAAITLRESNDALEGAVNANSRPTASYWRGPMPSLAHLAQEKSMPNPTLDSLTAEITRTKSIEQSALQLINGIADRIQAAVDAAIAGGATAEDLAPVTQEIEDLRAQNDALAAAVQANTTPPPAAAAGKTQITPQG